ncbi:MAG: hypothetical protein HY815_21180 [Candidatus Riflebacteria bacterium]|nr:hypothetical protein [Candidatus Riflebacteria bacterium]
MKPSPSNLFAAYLAAGLIAATFPGPALAAATATEFTPVVCDENGQVVEESLEKALVKLKSRKPAPEHLVLLVHGFNVTVNASTTMFNQVGRLVRSTFGRFKKRVEIVGVQWPSATGGDTRWIKKSVRHKVLGIGHDPYLKKAELAAAVGRQGMRQIVLRHVTRRTRPPRRYRSTSRTARSNTT